MLKQSVMWSLVVLLSGCGSDAGGEDAGDTGGDSGSASGNNGPQNGNGSGNDSGPRDGGLPNGDGGKDGGSGSGNNTGNSMAITGPTKVTGAVAGIKLVSGLAYFDPIGRLDDNDPALKIVLTDWPITGCDPQAIWDMADPTNTKHLVACEIYRYRKSLPHPLYISEGNEVTWRTIESEGCTVELTSGDDDGGEQVIGTINVTEWNNANGIKSTIQVQVNHCGVIDTKGNI
jgi:hypothetical protein